MRKPKIKQEIKQAIIEQPDAILAASAQQEARTDRTNFSYEIKARIFARDRAICGFTGLNLWLLDEGACGFYNFESADHITPATKGGLSDEENGIMTHSAWNYEKGDNANFNIYLFNGGFPTNNFWVFNRQISLEMAQRIVRFEQMHPSDFHFNNAVGRVISGVFWLHDGEDKGRTRDDDYWAKATLNHLARWKQSVDADEVTSLEERGLVLEPLLPDQELLLSVREMTTTEQIKQLSKDVLPYHIANHSVIYEFQIAYTRWLRGYQKAFEPILQMLENPLVSEVVYQNTLSNIQLLINPFHDWQAEAEAQALLETENEGN